MMKATIGADGRITFPKPLLKTLGITCSTKVYIDNNGESIIIKPVEKICSLCHGKENMIEGFPICRSCGEKVQDVMNLDYES